MRERRTQGVGGMRKRGQRIKREKERGEGGKIQQAPGVFSLFYWPLRSVLYNKNGIFSKFCIFPPWETQIRLQAWAQGFAT